MKLREKDKRGYLWVSGCEYSEAQVAEIAAMLRVLAMVDDVRNIEVCDYQGVLING